jgi:hypothetical protein
MRRRAGCSRTSDRALPLLVPRAERIEIGEPAGPEPVEGGEMP